MVGVPLDHVQFDILQEFRPLLLLFVLLIHILAFDDVGRGGHLLLL